MIIRLVINLIRWSWGYPSMDVPEKISENQCLLMMFGAIIDVLAVVLIVGFTVQWWTDRRRARKESGVAK